MEITTLDQRPELYDDVLKLIHKSFNYSEKNSFAVDFYPLIKKENHHNCYILLKEGALVGHIAIKKKSFTINNTNHSFIMIGGVAINLSYRGKGCFKTLLNHILKDLKNLSFAMLWSDKLELYQKFDFHPCVELFEYNISKSSSSFKRTKLHKLSKDEFEQIKSLYTKSNEIRVSRSRQDWEDLKMIKSADLYIKKNTTKISNYFFMNKGEDLKSIIYEYGHLKDYKEIAHHGTLWTPESLPISDERKNIMYASLIKILDLSLFKKFIYDFTNSQIDIINDDVKFNFNMTQYTFNLPDFLTGVFGPSSFQELNCEKKIMISGLDSI